MDKQILSIEDLLDSFEIHLQAKGRSSKTIFSYRLAVNQLIEFLAEQGLPTDSDKIQKKHVEKFLAHFQETRASATVRQRYASLKQFFKWAAAEEEIREDPMERITPPRVVEQPVPVLSLEEVRALLIACKQGDMFKARRDEAIIRLFLDTGLRLGELAGLKKDDVDLKLRVAHVLGKGSRFRSVPFNDVTNAALDRYRRQRSRHPRADADDFWLGPKGKLSSSGIAQMVARRSADAGLPKIHPHQFRHTFAHQWLSRGGAEGDLQRIAGWSSPQMLQRYGASVAEQRAQEAHRRLGLWEGL